MTVADLAPWAWVALVVAAVIVGVSKTALPGASTVSVVLFAAVIPAKISTAALLLLLLVGDAFALLAYRRHADWRALLRLLPAVAVGIAAGAAFLAFASDSGVRRTIGIILLVMVVLTLLRRRLRREVDREHPHPVLTAAYGSLGGFTTMVANAGGPVMSLYFVAARFPVLRFLGTAAWFFASVNVVKVPIAIGLGLLPPSVLFIDLLLVPAVVAGAGIGWFVAKRITQTVFEAIVVSLTIVGALYLALA